MFAGLALRLVCLLYAFSPHTGLCCPPACTYVGQLAFLPFFSPHGSFGLGLPALFVPTYVHMLSIYWSTFVCCSVPPHCTPGTIPRNAVRSGGGCLGGENPTRNPPVLCRRVQQAFGLSHIHRGGG